MTPEQVLGEIDSVLDGAFAHIDAERWALLASDIGHIRGLVDSALTALPEKRDAG